MTLGVGIILPEFAETTSRNALRDYRQITIQSQVQRTGHKLLPVHSEVKRQGILDS